MWFTIYCNMWLKIIGHTSTNTPKVFEIVKYNIFLTPEKAMLA